MTARVVYVGSYPPRRCGIATFTADLRSSVGGSSWVYALAPIDGSSDIDESSDGAGAASREVRAILTGHRPADYGRAADAIDAAAADVVSIQHEFGLYGGPDGVNLLALTERLRTPIVTTYHTILGRPTPSQRAILHALADRSAVSVVMSRTAAHLLSDRYAVDPRRVVILPHGVPDLPRVDPARARHRVGLPDRPMILSFGLIGPGKGYEMAVEAMATVVRAVPDALYVILGATHPDLLRRDGERYRDALRARVGELELDDHVYFEDRFVSARDLGR